MVGGTGGRVAERTDVAGTEDGMSGVGDGFGRVACVGTGDAPESESKSSVSRFLGLAHQRHDCAYLLQHVRKGARKRDATRLCRVMEAEQ
jgi:hypothetical protein